MLEHSFYRFYVVTKFILPSIKDLHFSQLNNDSTCAYLDNNMLDLVAIFARKLSLLYFIIKDDKIIQQHCSHHL